jgi:hypothetical protein
MLDQYVRQSINSLLSKFTAHSLPVLNHATLQNSLSILGALLIVIALVFVGRKHFPGWWATTTNSGRLSDHFGRTTSRV